MQNSVHLLFSFYIDFVYPFQNERPNLDEEAIPDYIQSLLQSCWSNNPLRRPEFREISVSLEEMLNGIEPGWDSIDPGILASRPDETKTLLGKAKKISTSMFSCFPSCHSIRTRLCSCCPSCHSIHTRVCCCCPSCHSIRTRLSSCWHSISTRLCCCCPSCDSILTRLCCCLPSFQSIRTRLCCCCPFRKKRHVSELLFFP